MAAPNFQATALMVEKVLSNPATFWPKESTLYDLIKPKKVEVSGRAMRIPLKLLKGGVSSMISIDGGAFARGSAYVPDVATINPVYFGHSTEVTAADMVATDSDAKAVENFVTDNISQQKQNFTEFQESQMVGDGSGSLGAAGTIDTTGGIYTIPVANPHLFNDSQLLDIWSAVGGTKRGTVLVLSVDYVNKTITLNNTVPSRFTGVSAPASVSGFIAGDLFFPYGADGTATGSLLGIRYHQNDVATGTWMGVNRATYPGKLRTPHVAGAGATLSQGIVRLGLDKLARAEGVEGADLDNLVFVSGPDMRAQWEGVGTLISSIIFNQLPGDNAVDAMKKNSVAQIGGRKLVVSNRAAAQRIDGLCLNHWGKAEIIPMGPYSPTGQTAYLTYGANGSIATSLMYYMWAGYNLFTDKCLAGLYFDGLAAQANY